MLEVTKSVNEGDEYFILFYFDEGDSKVKMVNLVGFAEYPDVFQVQETLDSFMYDILPNIDPKDYENCGVFMKTLSSTQMMEVLELG